MTSWVDIHDRETFSFHSARTTIQRLIGRMISLTIVADSMMSGRGCKKYDVGLQADRAHSRRFP